MQLVGLEVRDRRVAVARRAHRRHLRRHHHQPLHRCATYMYMYCCSTQYVTTYHVVCFTATVSYSFRVGRVFHDGVVLQRAPYNSVVWGFGPAGGDVTLSLVKYNESVQQQKTSVEASGAQRKLETVANIQC